MKIGGKTTRSSKKIDIIFLTSAAKVGTLERTLDPWNTATTIPSNYEFKTIFIKSMTERKMQVLCLYKSILK